MENASKALIIAGAILITLIIIGLGVAILGSTEGATDTSTFDAMQVSTFNGKFSPYKGTVQGSKLTSLLDVLLANARAGGDEAQRPQVCVKGGFTTTNIFKEDKSTNDSAVAETDYITFIKNIKKEVKSSHRYKVTMDEHANTDLIHYIVIDAQSTSTSTSTPTI